MPPHRPLLAAALLACMSWTGPSHAADHAKEFVPELNAFIKLTALTRVYLLGDLTVQRPNDLTEAEVGAHLDYTLKPVLRPQLRDADWARVRYLWTRVGYVVLGDPDGADTSITERRGVLELTGRMPLPQEVWLTSRGRIDLRDLDGVMSQRYRLRLGVEREFTVDGVVLVPYAQAETFYDTRYDRWNRQLYQAGIEIEISKTWRIEPYLARQNDSMSAAGNADRLGLVLKVYH